MFREPLRWLRVTLRARCCGPANEDPLIPPGPEGSNGTGVDVWRDLPISHFESGRSRGAALTLHGPAELVHDLAADGLEVGLRPGRIAVHSERHEQHAELDLRRGPGRGRSRHTFGGRTLGVRTGRLADAQGASVRPQPLVFAAILGLGAAARSLLASISPLCPA